MRTLGGKQRWSDVYLYGGWRIQCHARTGEHRLLDPLDRKRAGGSLIACRQALAAARKREQAVLGSDRLVILLHGYLRSKDSLRKLKRALEESRYEVYDVNYPSTWLPAEAIVENVRELLAAVSPDFREIYFVSHSMGGLIVRGVLESCSNPKVKRAVLIAPPNTGALMGERAARRLPLRWAGPASRQFGRDEEGYAQQVGAPACPFGVIAGGKGNDRGYAPFIPGDNDGMVAVDETHLPGMADFEVVRGVHTFIMNHPDTIQYVRNFLAHGAFHPEPVEGSWQSDAD